jgi:kumamolisin
MANSNKKTLPAGYVPFPGSEQRPSKGALLLGPADDVAVVDITIILRRRPDGAPVPGFDYYAKTPPAKRRRLPMDEFAKKYGAHPDELHKVVKFAGKSGLKVIETHAARRSVTVSGTVAQMNKVFVIELSLYRRTVKKSRKSAAVDEIYRGHNGLINMPEELAGIIIGVFGLDNRKISKRNSGDPVNTNPISVSTVTRLYNFPPNLATGQNIAIFSGTGYLSSDIASTFGGHPPTVVDIPVNSHNLREPDSETTQDICIAAAAAQGAAIFVYFNTSDQAGWVMTVGRVVHPDPGDRACAVLSSSFFVSDVDDPAEFNENVTVNWLNAVTMAFEDAAIQAVTVCVASGDVGSESNGGDDRPHVQYPASDPWVLSVGGTTIGNINGDTFDEFVWNDTYEGGFFATGGGVSAYFPKPEYQNNAGIPLSLLDGSAGRGVPDVAANASTNSGYPITVNGMPAVGSGTSASAPFWAGLIAVINAALGDDVGFINPYIYQRGSAIFRDILGAPGPANNSVFGIPGYPAGPGWDACTGWGSPNGAALLNAFQHFALPAVYISGGFQSPDIILTDLVHNTPVPIGGMPGPWGTLLQPNTDYGFSAVIHNDSAVTVNNVEVTFWAMLGGLGTDGYRIGVPHMAPPIPPHSSVIVNSPVPFASAPLKRHLCAVVSLYHAETGCMINARHANQISDPGLPGTRACSAWRNTDSMFITESAAFRYLLGLREDVAHLPAPVLLQVQSLHVPAGWMDIAAVKDLENTLNFIGAKYNYPLYLLPEIKKNFSSIDLKTKISAVRGGKIEETEPGWWHLYPNGKEEEIPIEVTGEAPVGAKKGDIILMDITAHYPKTGGKAARSTGFLEVIHVIGKNLK